MLVHSSTKMNEESCVAWERDRHEKYKGHPQVEEKNKKMQKLGWEMVLVVQERRPESEPLKPTWKLAVWCRHLESQWTSSRRQEVETGEFLEASRPTSLAYTVAKPETCPKWGERSGQTREAVLWSPHVCCDKHTLDSFTCTSTNILSVIHISFWHANSFEIYNFII